MRDIFSKSTKSISISYLINEKTAFPLKEISSEENASLLYRATSSKSSNVEVRFVKDSKNDKEINIEVWTSNIHYKTIQLSELSIKQVYFDEIFGKPQFSEDMKKLIFLAEVDEKKALKPYFSLTEDEKFDEEFEKSLTKFEFKQEFGELLTGKSDPKVFVLDLSQMKIFNLKFNNLGNNFISHPIFDEKSEGVLFTAYDFPYFKLGLIYCMKRKADIYYLRNPKLEEMPKKAPKSVETTQIGEKIDKQALDGNDFKEAVKISGKDNTNFLQKFSSDFNFLIYFSNEIATPHNNGLRLNLIRWKENPQNSRVLIDKIIKCNDFFNGIYIDDWVSGSLNHFDFG